MPARAGKIRNNTVVAVLGLIVGVVAYVAHWSVWLGRMTEVPYVPPTELRTYRSAINVLGPWSIFGWTPTGFWLWGIWAIEAIMILAIGVHKAAFHGLGIVELYSNQDMPHGDGYGGDEKTRFLLFMENESKMFSAASGVSVPQREAHPFLHLDTDAVVWIVTAKGFGAPRVFDDTYTRESQIAVADCEFNYLGSPHQPAKLVQYDRESR